MIKKISRRNFLSITGTFVLSVGLKAQRRKGNNGLAAVGNKRIPDRTISVIPPGASGIQQFSQHCTACQLCVSVCPDRILQPSSSLRTFMQPEISYKRGYCRLGCTKCSEVCPTGAIRPVATTAKPTIQIGYAVWLEENCIITADNKNCRKCRNVCSAGAIRLIQRDSDSPGSRRIPVVDTEKCTGCGACEYVCPAHPFSGIYVEGYKKHRILSD